MNIDNRPISYAQIVAFVVVIATNAFVAGGIYWSMSAKIEAAATKDDLDKIAVRVETMESYRVQRSAQTDKNFGEINQKLAPLSELQNMQTRAEQNLKATNERIDRIVESFSGRFDQLITAVNQVKVDVGTLTGEIRALSPGKRAEIRGEIEPVKAVE
jgi:TolA-binding protein